MATGNVFADSAPPPEGERFETLLAHAGLVIERIVSSSRIAAHTYAQEQDEWVVLLRGQAVLDVSGVQHSMMAGDHLFLPSGTPHAVVSVSAGALWIAVHRYPAPVNA